MKKKMCEPGLTNTPIMDRLLAEVRTDSPNQFNHKYRA